jgi:hypothetical protein
VVDALRYRPKGRGFDIKIRWVNFSVYLILPAELVPRVYSPSKGNEYLSRKMFLGSRARAVLKDDNLTAISKLIVLTMLNPQYLRTL